MLVIPGRRLRRRGHKRRILGGAGQQRGDLGTGSRRGEQRDAHKLVVGEVANISRISRHTQQIGVMAYDRFVVERQLHVEFDAIPRLGRRCKRGQ